MAEYDPSNVFARILRGEIPCHRVYEDEHTLVFMDVMPQAEGHCLVVPKAPSRNLLDASPAVLGHLMGVVQMVAKASMKAFESDGATIIQFNEPAAGQTVFHLHVHVIPRRAGVELEAHADRQTDAEELAANAERLIAALGG